MNKDRMSYPVLQLFNTESRRLEPVVPTAANTLKMYTCGPTVYHFAHIGNFRTYVFEDVLRRTIRFFGMNVQQVMNLTDVDDKTIRGALEKGVTLKEFTEPYIKAFFEDIETLGMEKAEAYPAATEYIPSMIALIQTLLKRGVAYVASDKSVYYSIRKFPSYGRLSHLDMQELKAKQQLESVDEYDKDNVADFVLWKAHDETRDGQIFWESPFGRGRPGWHIECSAMAMELLGPSIDIHAGGVDNMFPHHENEIAQCEGCTGTRFVRIWVHAEHLLVDHKKMSKSLGNFYTLRDLIEKGFTGRQVRFMLLSSHYRMQLNFTLEGLKGAAASLERIDACIYRLREMEDPLVFGKVGPLLRNIYEGFSLALADDLNMAKALASLFDGIRAFNALMDQKLIGKSEALEVLRVFQEIDRVLGVLFTQEESIPKELAALLEQREKARLAKNWKVADECRDMLQSKGYAIEDTPKGARLKKTRTPCAKNEE